MQVFPTYIGEETHDDVDHVRQVLVDVFDTVRQPLLVLDSEFRVVEANRAFFRVFQVDPRDTVGKVLFALGDGQWDIPPLRALLRDRLSVEPHVEDLDVDHVFPRIGHKIMLVSARVVSGGAKAPRMTLVAIEDVTARRVAEQQLATQRRELERSNLALDEFASVAAHDLQEPLRKILSFGERLDTAAASVLDGPAREYLTRMLGAAARMRSLINDLLAFSQTSTRVHPFAATDLTAVVREVITDLETVIEAAGAGVEVGTLPVIDADPLQMRQLFQNVLANALKFRRKDVSPVVRVSASSNGERCTITIADNGIGFNEAYGEKIFRMFERLHGRTQYEGSGIGLAICRKIAERHGGTIAATSTAGQGATFTITLPVTQAATAYTR